MLDDTLSAAQLSKVFGASRATIYREFESKGGVRQYMSDLRLRRALLLLSNASTERGAVSKVAGELGYDDPSLFSRAFRDHFGFPPRDVLFS